MRSAATIEYQRRYREQMMLTQLRAEIAQRFPGAESSAEAQDWARAREEELRKERGL